MRYKDERVLISEFDDDAHDYGYEYIERSDGSHVLRIWGDGFIQREIEFDDFIKKVAKFEV